MPCGYTPEADGAIHLYVSVVDGDDDDDGQTPATAFATIQRAVEELVASGGLMLDIDTDLVVEIANGVYSEYVDIRLPRAPKRRLIIRGDRDSMTVLFSDVLTGASAVLLTDAGAAFGINPTQARRMVRVWDPADEAGTQQWKEIRSNTVTTLTPVEPFGIAPMIGWNYEVLTPAVRIVGNPAEFAERNFATIFSAALPWGSAGSGSSFAVEGLGPILMLGWLGIESFGFDGANCLSVLGGDVFFLGVVCEGDSFEVVTAGSCGMSLGGFFSWTNGDPVFDLPPFDFVTLIGVSLGIRMTTASSVGLALRNSTQALGLIVIMESGGIVGFPIFLYSASLASLSGGATHAGRNIVGENCECDFNGNTIPFLVRNSPASGIEVRGQSQVEVLAVEFDGIAGSAIAALRSVSFVGLIGPLTAGTVGVAGFCFDAQNGCQVQVAAGAGPELSGGAGDFRVEAVVSTWGVLIVGAPEVGANTGARAWRTP